MASHQKSMILLEEGIEAMDLQKTPTDKCPEFGCDQQVIEAGGKATSDITVIEHRFSSLNIEELKQSRRKRTVTFDNNSKDELIIDQSPPLQTIDLVTTEPTPIQSEDSLNLSLSEADPAFADLWDMSDDIFFDDSDNDDSPTPVEEFSTQTSSKRKRDEEYEDCNCWIEKRCEIVNPDGVTEIKYNRVWLPPLQFKSNGKSTILCEKCRIENPNYK